MTTIDRAHHDGPPSLGSVLDALGVAAGRWNIDPLASTFELRGRYVLGPAVTTRFAIDSGRVEITKDQTAITATLLIDAASLDSGIGLRDQHLRERRRALDVARFPTIRFDLDRATPGRDTTFHTAGASPSATSPARSSSKSTRASRTTWPSSRSPVRSITGRSRSTCPG